LRIGIADQFDPEDVTLGSGWTAATVNGIRDVVAEAVPLNIAGPPRLARGAFLASLAVRMRPGDYRDLRGAIQLKRNGALMGRPTLVLRWFAARRRLAQSGSIDGLVQRGCEVRLPAGVRFVTHQDSTLRQAFTAYPWPHLRGLTERDVERYANWQLSIYRMAAACCVATHWVKNSIVSDYGIDPARVHVVGLGANHVVDPPPSRDWSVPRFLFVGADWKRKNGDAVLKAFARVRERHPDARLDVVGGHPAIDLPGVTGHGSLSIANEEDRGRISRLYVQSTAYVMPSLHEPAGSVYVEAASAGIASIGGTNGGSATAIGSGGILVDPTDDGAITAAMLKLSDPGTAARLGALAHEHARSHTWRKVAERLVRALAIPGVDASGLASFL
jgi:glycosyltransferase involved in cell wall biosynthesis